MPEAEVAVDTVTVDDGMGVWSHSPGMPPAFLGEVDGTLLRPVAGYITLDEYTMFDPVPMYPPGGEDELPRNSEARLLALNALALRTAIVHADSEDVRETVARLAPTDVLADMTGDRCEAIRRIVASRLPIGSPELAGMADDTAPWVRKQAAHRVPVGSPAWSKLAQDENEVVRDVANHRR